MDKQSLAKRIYAASHLTGSFKLRSGSYSTEYFDKYLYEADPALLRDIAEYMEGLIPENAQVLAGLEMGAISVAAALSLQTGLHAAFVRKKAKEYGTCKLAEGADVNGKRVCVIEDTVTTGGQVIESVKELRKLGAVINHVVCVIQRNPEATALLAAEGLELIPAFTMDYLKTAAEA